MKQYKWFFLALIGFLFFLVVMGGIACNIGGLGDLRGNNAVIFAIFFALVSAASIVTLVIQTLIIAQTPGSKFGGILFVFALIFVGLFTIAYLSKQYCH